MVPAFCKLGSTWLGISAEMFSAAGQYIFGEYIPLGCKNRQFSTVWIRIGTAHQAKPRLNGFNISNLVRFGTYLVYYIVTYERGGSYDWGLQITSIAEPGRSFNGRKYHIMFLIRSVLKESYYRSCYLFINLSSVSVKRAVKLSYYRNMDR